MKMLWMADRQLGEEFPAQEVEWAVVEAAKAARMTMPPVKMGWRREMPDTVEIGPVQFSGAKPIWYWEVR
jgi:hypothetical protein